MTTMDEQAFLQLMRRHLRRAERDPSTMRRSVLGMAAALRQYQEEHSAEVNEEAEADPQAGKCRWWNVGRAA